VTFAGLFDPATTTVLSDKQVEDFVSTLGLDDEDELQGGIVEEAVDMLGNLTCS
jgi:hypothetical protein